MGGRTGATVEWSLDKEGRRRRMREDKFKLWGKYNNSASEYISYQFSMKAYFCYFQCLGYRKTTYTNSPLSVWCRRTNVIKIWHLSFNPWFKWKVQLLVSVKLQTDSLMCNDYFWEEWQERMLQLRQKTHYIFWIWRCCEEFQAEVEWR